MAIIVSYFLLGGLAGLLAGLLGVGGGLIIVPVLAWSFNSQGFPAESFMHLAIGTSLATIVPTSLASVFAHHKKQAVQWPVFFQLTPGIILGALAGAATADLISSQYLRYTFGLFELMVAAQLFFAVKPQAGSKLPGYLFQSLAGFVIGGISAIVGIGGGTMTVPYLLWNNVTIQKAVATSSACGLPIAIAGATGFAVSGINSVLPDYATGYIYWPAFFGIALSSILFAPLGASLAHKIDGARLKKGFAFLLLLLGLKMLLGQ